MRTVVVAMLAVGCGSGGDIPDVPVATLGALGAQLTGNVDVPFTISDRAGRLVNATVAWGTGPEPTEPCTPADDSPALLGLSTTEAGATHSFVWDSVADVGYERLESVYVAVRVEAGAVDGIGDEAGPFVVDNTGVPRAYEVTGSVCRSSVLFGNPTADLAGKLYLGVWPASAGYPPSGPALEGLDLGAQDFADTGLCVAYALAPLAPGNYTLIAILDHNDNNFTTGGYAIDGGDLTNGGGTQVQLVAADVTQDVVLNYGY